MTDILTFFVGIGLAIAVFVGVISKVRSNAAKEANAKRDQENAQAQVKAEERRAEIDAAIVPDDDAAVAAELRRTLRPGS